MTKLSILNFKKIYSLFIVSSLLYVDPLISQEKNTVASVGYSSNISYSSITGKIIVPEDPNYISEHYNEIVIRIAGLDYSNEQSSQLEFTPDQNGYFQIDNIFHTGSSVLLYIWDKSGFLNRRILPVYAGKNQNYYSVSLNTVGFIGELSASFSLDEEHTNKQLFEKSGLCGYSVGLSPEEIQGSQVTLQNISNPSETYSPSYFTDENFPSHKDNFLPKNGHFCFFNVGRDESSNENYYYQLTTHLKDGTTRSFNVYLPPYYFLSDVFFDINSAVLRPINANYINNGNENKSKFSKVNGVNLYSEINKNSMLIRNKDKGSLYLFPLGDDFLNLYYQKEADTDTQYFILKPTPELFSKNLSQVVTDYSPGQVYVDREDYVNLNLFNVKYLNRLNKNSVPLSSSRLGAVIFSIDLKKMNVNTNDVSVYIKNIAGNDISLYAPIPSDKKDFYYGYFNNIPLGAHQFYLINSGTREIIWTSIVHSLPNKVQFINLTPYQDKNNHENVVAVTDNKNIEISTDAVNSEQKPLSNQLVDIIPWNTQIQNKITKNNPRNSKKKQAVAVKSAETKNNVSIELDDEKNSDQNNEKISSQEYTPASPTQSNQVNLISNSAAVFNLDQFTDELLINSNLFSVVSDSSPKIVDFSLDIFEPKPTFENKSVIELERKDLYTQLSYISEYSEKNQSYKKIENNETNQTIDSILKVQISIFSDNYLSREDLLKKELAISSSNANYAQDKKEKDASNEAKKMSTVKLEKKDTFSKLIIFDKEKKYSQF